jgi:hypothetical protein
MASAAPAGIHTLLLRNPSFIIFACFSLNHPRNQLHLRNTQPTQLNAYAAGFYERRFRRNLILAKESTDDVSSCVCASGIHTGGNNVSSWKMTCSRRLELIRQAMEWTCEKQRCACRQDVGQTLERCAAGKPREKLKRDRIALLRDPRCTHPKSRTGATRLHHEADRSELKRLTARPGSRGSPRSCHQSHTACRPNALR